MSGLRSSMDPEHWRRVEELFHAALEQKPHTRQTFLDVACAEDSDLRRQVELLLTKEEEAGSFLETPALRDMVTQTATMALLGEQLGPYRIVSLLGAGGMGEVYRAHDVKLDRDVAIKTLPVEFAQDVERVERLRREARTLASMNHPNIAAIHGLEESGGMDFLVLELVEGEALRGPLPVPTALDRARQVAEALEAAHNQGIIHRDLKPANIKVTPQGRVKVLDFGLAKATLRPDQNRDRSRTQTLTGADTLAGHILGTPGYMSPEQARGKEVDERTDIWAFGCLLFELLSGKRAFQGESNLGTIAALQEREPDLQVLPAKTPMKVRELLRRCLQKDPARRLDKIADARRTIEELQRGSTGIGRSSKAIIPAAAVVLALSISSYFYFRREPKLTNKDTIVLADFTNTTGDPVFDGTLRQAMAVQLEQSPFLSLVSEQQIQQTLTLMGQPGDAKLTPAIAVQLCQRTGSTAVLEGSIAKLGSQYVLGFKAVNCKTGNNLSEEQGRAANKEQVLTVADTVAVSLRRSLGESLSSVEKFSTPLEQATTPSLEALQAYSLATQKNLRGEVVPSIPFFERAIQLDANFAMAYVGLGYVYSNINEAHLAAVNFKKAYDLRDRVSGREKLVIEAAYYWMVLGDLRKTIQALEILEQTYPRDVWTPSDLSVIYGYLGDHEKALVEAQEAARRDPTVKGFVLTPAYLNLNRFDEARTMAEEAVAKDPDSFLRIFLYQLAFLRNDATEMAKQVALSAGKPGLEHVMLGLEAGTAAYYGRLGEARNFSHRAVASLETMGNKEGAAAYVSTAAVREGLCGNRDQARQGAIAALAISTGRDAQFQAAEALAFAGDALRAQALADKLAKGFPEDTIVQFSFLPRIRAQLALDHNQAQKAVKALEAVSPYELGIGSTLPVYMHGEAYLAAHQHSEAAAEFQKILDHRGIVVNEPIGALAHLGLGRAYATAGDAVKAKAAYQDFLTLWKDADPDIPILKKAKAEYAKLR